MGSSANANGTAIPSVGQRGQPHRSATGNSSAANSAVNAATEANVLTQPAVIADMLAIGSMVRAANGG